ncbi:MAG: signal peptidase I [Cellvibrionales bacterium TMED148]|nr:signal peptidase I [Porticoccaceae bacterium]RPG90109.1 MAG: signal peptidase I [Cellvibrionales bacterium TMED148]
MNFNFELILTSIFIVSFTVWLANHLIFKHKEGPLEFIASLASVLGIVLILRSFVVEPFQIPSKSMVPTLQVGDFILVNKWTYGLRLPVLRHKFFEIRDPNRGDVVVFFPPHEDRYFIKRLVGLPGDEVRVISGVLYINGEKVKQLALDNEPEDSRSVVMNEYLNVLPHTIHKRLLPTQLSLNYTSVVPEGHYFMMGDNRDNSSDSRVWGPVPAQRVVGKAFARWMFWDEFLSIPNFSRAGWIN